MFIYLKRLLVYIIRARLTINVLFAHMHKHLYCTNMLGGDILENAFGGLEL